MNSMRDGCSEVMASMAGRESRSPQGLLLSVIIPVYNEAQNIAPLVARLRDVLGQIGCTYEILFCADPSTDGTEAAIMAARAQDPRIGLITFSRRFGQPAAVLAGLHYCRGDACVVIDADLQDPPELIADLVAGWCEGYDVVYAQRVSRAGETWVKRVVCEVGYWLLNHISDVSIPRNAGDFRLLSRRVINELKKLHEREGFLRGMVAYVGFDQKAVPYHRDARAGGAGKYNRLLGSLTIALNGFIGFSKYPLHVISIMGLVISFASLTLGAIYLSIKLLIAAGVISWEITWGNPTMVILISLLSGVQLLSLGIMGQYMARMYDEIKQRPAYIVREVHLPEEG
ncbi:MAG: glycosyltransferase [bacterium]|nr:glycosyltransferase [bacterium]